MLATMRVIELKRNAAMVVDDDVMRDDGSPPSLLPRAGGQ